ncbi:MAG: hypothetical protein EP335_05785 [Alphaproteobacteria bacterium]|nr:MAG: hypothetical protein EP335_05785 [Alphaproteobacteria bacterium]
MIQEYRLKLWLQGPILTRSSDVGDFGIDTVFARLPDGTPYIAGSHVLGKLRHALRILGPLVEAGERTAALDAWLGTNEGDVFKGQDGRRPVYVSDLVAETKGVSGRRTRIKISPETGTVEPGALQVMEQPYGVGETVLFTGALRLLMPEADAMKAARLLERALNWLTQMGGMRGIGFGRVDKATLHDNSAATSTSLVEGAPARLALKLVFSDPFCIADRRAGKNLFSSSHIVPGSAFKGALAHMMQIAAGPDACSTLARHLSALRVTHFYPSAKGNAARRRPCPRSLVSTSAGLADIALVDGPCLIGGEVPAFGMDWKSKAYEAAEDLFGDWPSSQLRVRTAVSSETLSASPEQLFAYELSNVDKHDWHGELGLADVPVADRKAIIHELSTLLAHGIAPLGRSGAHASLCISWGADARTVQNLREGDLHVLTLASPALILDQRNAYGPAISDVFDGAVDLVRCFTSERMAGADFMANRFSAGRAYRPWLLTETGSVFVVRIKDPETAAQKLNDLQAHGLPLTRAIRETYLLSADGPDLWRECPYIRQNGFGEIIVDQQEHLQMQPAPTSLTLVKMGAA